MENYNESFPQNAMFGHAYVMNQKLKKIFSPEEAIETGTIFPELVSPYSPCDSLREIEYLKEDRSDY